MNQSGLPEKSFGAREDSPSRTERTGFVPGQHREMPFCLYTDPGARDSVSETTFLWEPEPWQSQFCSPSMTMQTFSERSSAIYVRTMALSSECWQAILRRRPLIF